MTRRLMRAVPVIGLLLGLAVTVTGCGPGGAEPAADATPSAAAPATPDPAPPVGACYQLDFDEAIAPASEAAAVPCSQPHTSVTYEVGVIDSLADGHLLAVDSQRVQQQVVNACRAKLGAFVGGSPEAQRLSRLVAIGFAPSLAQADLGAQWYRCDLVLVAAADELGRLPRKAHGLLDAADALDKYGTCGTAAPAAEKFQRVACGRPHTWRVRASVDLPDDASYLDKAAGDAADATCRDIVAGIAADRLHLRWSFEWPTRDQWDDGQRYGYCWTPDPA